MRSIINILDFTTAEIEQLISVATDMMNNPDKYNESCKHKTLGTLFFEPSTRTRLSFESAMLSLGGNVLGVSSADSSSASKGESVSDTITVVSGYVDIIAMRHPKEGAAFVGSKVASVPIINAGDGGHYHPTQTLADLCTIYQEKGRLNNLTVGICGDLKFGRTVHSLIGALSRYTGIKFVLISPKELALPEFVKKNLIIDKGIECVESTSLENSIKDLDILYMTRIQGERFTDKAEYEKLKDVYVLDTDKMALAKEDMIVMHPLPRVNEISVKVDSDKRACYFKQTRNGKFMRMALILKLLTEQGIENVREEKVAVPVKKCANVHCISKTEQELESLGYVSADGTTHCLYCDGVIK